MTDELKVEEVQGVSGRRKFLKTAAQVAVTAPAAIILLNATTIRPAAAALYGVQIDGTAIDDVGNAASCVNNTTLTADHAINNPLDCPAP